VQQQQQQQQGEEAASAADGVRAALQATEQLQHLRQHLPQHSSTAQVSRVLQAATMLFNMMHAGSRYK
jgi:hypothetical protein